MHVKKTGSATLWLVAILASNVSAQNNEFSMKDNESAQYQVLQKRSDRLMVKLPNRMIVIAQELRSAPVVSAQVWIKTGSIYEQEHVGAGLSHFLEHLASGGTTSTRTEEESTTILGAIGAQTNAATSLDTVRYYINTTSSHVAEAIDLLSDWMQNSQFIPDQYSREQQVIQREFEHGQGNPNRILWKLTQQIRYQVHPARHPIIGYLDEFLTVSRNEIHAFYKRMYVPNNMVFVVVGDIDKSSVVQQITKAWSKIPDGQLPDLSFPVEPEITQPRQTLGYADIRRPRLRLVWPGTKLTEPGDYALDLLAVILGHGESSRLVQTVRDEQRLANVISAHNNSYSWGRGYFSVDAEIAVPDNQQQNFNEVIKQTQAAILEQIERVRLTMVTDEELARAKRKTLANVIYNAQTSQLIASRMARDVISMGDPDYLYKYAQAIQKISSKDVKAAAHRFLSPPRLITVTMLPRPKNRPFEPLKRPIDEKNPSQFESDPIDLDNRILIEKIRTQVDQQTTTIAPVIESPKMHVLPNGLRLIISRSTLVPAVSIQLYQLGGLLSDTPGQEGVANAVANMQIKGTTTRSAQDIAQTVDNLGAQLNPQCGNNTSHVAGQCLKEDWPTVLNLVADIFLNPSFPQAEWKKLQPRLIAAIARQQDQWGGELRSYFRPAYFGNHPWSQTVLGRGEVVQSLTIDDLKRFHANHLGASNTVLALFGDVDPQLVRQQVERLFNIMPHNSKIPFKPHAPTPPVSRQVKEKTQKPMAAVQIGFGPGVTLTSENFPAIQVLGRLLSAFPAGWLEQELRGKGQGLVYSVGAGSMTGIVPGYFATVFNVKPSDITLAVNRAMEVIHRARSELVSKDELQRAKGSVLTRVVLGQQSNTQRASEAALNALYGLGPDAAARFIERVNQLDAKRLMEIAQTYLNNEITVIMLPEV